MDFVAGTLPLVGMLVFLGAFAGFLAGLLGVGGGIILVPGLYFVFSLLQPNLGFDSAHLMHLCVGTSLAIIVPTGLSSVLAHHRRGSVDLHLVGNIGTGIVLGVILATWIAQGLDSLSMKMIFASAILILAIIMIINPVRFKIDGEEPKQPFCTFAGIVIGGLSTLIGVGGGTLSVPYMSLHGVAMHRAVGTASALGLVIAVPAAIGFMIIGGGHNNLPLHSIGYVNTVAWCLISPISVLAAPLGANTAHKISTKKLKMIFAVFMVIIALDMWRKILIGT